MSTLNEPLNLGQETLSRRIACGGKTRMLLSSMLAGFGVAVIFSSMPSFRSEVEDPAMDMLGLSCQRPNMPISVHAMQDALKQYGIPSSSPLATYAITQFAATRDVSMAGQAREAFMNLNPETQAKVKKLSRDVVVRASDIKPQQMAGATYPLGFWDPWGFSKNPEYKMSYLRAAELKHSRVCMLATLGFVVEEKYHPFFDAWGDGPFESAVKSHFSATAMSNFWPAFLVLTGALEYYGEFRGSDEPMDNGGDLKFDPLGLRPTKPDMLKELQTKEINNGRLAMVASAGLIAQELVSGQKVF